MASVLKKNLDTLTKFNPLIGAVAEGMVAAEDDRESLERRDDGVLYFRHDAHSYRLCSENKEEEAKWLTKDIDYERDNLMTVFGMGNVAFLRRLMWESSEETKIAVFEPNAYVVRYILRHENITDLISSKKFVFVFGDESTVDRCITVYFTQKWENLVQNLMVLSLPNYYVYSDYRMKVVKKISDVISHQLLSLGTSLEDMLDGFNHHYLNVDACLTANGLGEIRDKFAGYPAIIVASGPSLDKNIKYLKEAQGKALVITCDASYRACKANGVSPQVIASIERYRPTYQYFYEGMEFDERLVLAGPTLLWPETFQTFQGKKMLMAKSPDGLEGWWSAHFEPIEFLDMGHSCANTAFGVAQAAGCNPIILIGQDLAFTGEKVHSDQAHTKYEGANVAWKTPEEIWVEDIDGGKVRTTEIFNLFRYYFEDAITLSDRKVIDATEGGARIKGTTVMTFRDAIDQYCTRDLNYDVYGLLKDVKYDPKLALETYKKIKESGEDIIRRFLDVQKRVVDHFNVLMEYENYDFESATQEELVNIVLNMRAADDLVKYLVEEQNDLVSYYQQIIKQTIIYVKKIGNKLTGANVKRNWQLQLNLMHMVDISCVVTCQRFDGMVKFMEEKIQELEKAGDER